MPAPPVRFDGNLLLFGRDPADETAIHPPQNAMPDWVEADPRRIRAALARASAQPSGGWAVLDASRALRTGPRRYVLAGRELVLWLAPDGTVRAAPDGCPHMGASLACGRVAADGSVVCPWHGLALKDRRHGRWAPLRAYDDGVLTWVRLDALLSPGELATERPIVPRRPSRFLDAVVRIEVACAPADVLANRLDPWHGAHYHPHSFARLRVIGQDEGSITVRVVYRVAGRIGVEVDARFDCPDPRTIVMTIVAGEGTGSTVETHATPIAEGRTAIIEATLASTDRARWLPSAGAWLRGLVRSRAARLWVEDARYCERIYALRTARERTLEPIDLCPREEIEAE